MRKFLKGLLLRLLDKSLALDYKQIDKGAWDKWAYESFDNKGWKSYFAYEDLKIMKEMTFGKGPWEYAVLVGRRLQLLYLMEEMKKSFDNKKELDAEKARLAKKAEAGK